MKGVSKAQAKINKFEEYKKIYLAKIIKKNVINFLFDQLIMK